MSTRNAPGNRLCNPINPVTLLRRMGKALGVDVPLIPESIVNIPFPDVGSNTFREEYLCREVLRKYPGFNLGIDTSQVALSALYEQEVQNRETNIRLCDTSQSPKREVAITFRMASEKVRRILGDFRSDWFLDGLRHGPGSTTRLTCKDARIDGKLNGVPHVTSSAFQLAYTSLMHMPGWAYDISADLDPYKVLARCETDDIMCVPKNARTDRTIAVQPDMNVMLQLGVAYVMRKKLHKWGINLSHQSVNQGLARQASLTGELATLDLSNASNSMTCSLVWKMVGDHSFPTGNGYLWYAVLERLRTEAGLLPSGEKVIYELFSSMGNGYTFELESLIFWSLARSVCEFLGIDGTVSVYGDDIICPVEAVPLLSEVLAYSGFSLNKDKSFFNIEGPLFRESCGAHYLDGRDVTPFYCTKPLDTVEEIILLANNIKRWCRIGEWGLDGRLHDVWRWVVSHLSARARDTCIPYSEDNDGLIKDFDEAAPTVSYNAIDPSAQRNGYDRPFYFQGYRCKTVRLENRSVRLDGRRGLTVWLYMKNFRVFRWPCVGSTVLIVQPSEPIKLSGIRTTRRWGRRTVPLWQNTGPWTDA